MFPQHLRSIGVPKTMSTTATAAPLEYAPGAPVRRRRRVRRIVLLLLLVGVGLAGWRWWPAARDHAKLLYWQRECMNFQFAPDVVLYEQDPTKAAVLLRQQNPEYSPLPFYGFKLPLVTHAVYAPRALREFAARSSWVCAGPGNRSIAFCHERRTPAGKRRLVIVYTQPWSDGGPLWEWELYEPAGVITKPKLLSSGADPNIHRGMGGGWHIPIRAGAGQPDTADPTHFTFPWLVNGQKCGDYDGRLTNDDKVVVTRRDGKP